MANDDDIKKIQADINKIEEKKQALMSSAKRNLALKQKNMLSEYAAIQSELDKLGAISGDQVDYNLEEIKGYIEKEKAARAEITNVIRVSRIYKGNLEKKRADNILLIRETQTQIAQLRASSKREGSDKGVINQKIRDEEAKQGQYRIEDAKMAGEIATFRGTVSVGLQARETTEYNIGVKRDEERNEKQARSLYKRQEMAVQKEEGYDLNLKEYEERRKEKILNESERMTPSGLRKQLSRSETLDSEREGWKAREGIAGKGASRTDQLKYQEAAKEFTDLFNAIRETKKAMAELEEGTDELAEKQGALSEQEKKAADISGKMRDIEDRVGGGKKGGGISGGGIFSMVASTISDGFNALGQMASSRYILEEQVKSAKVGLGAKEWTDWQKRGTSAEALLMTGGGAAFGGESPYAGKGGVSGRIKRLGDDYSEANLGTKQMGIGFGTLASLPSEIAKAVAAGTVGGPGAAAAVGAAGVANLAKNLILSPEMLSLQGEENRKKEAVKKSKSYDRFSEEWDKFGGATGWVSGSSDKSKSENSTFMGMIADNIKNTLIRAGEGRLEQKKLESLQTQNRQQEEVRGRYSAFLAPLLQGYMDTQSSHRGIARTRYMTQAQRGEEYKGLDVFAQDTDLAEKGFGTAERVAAQGTAAYGLGMMGGIGRHGERMYQGVARTALDLEAAGMGAAGQSIQGQIGMARAGEKDPVDAMTRAFEKALLAGLGSSRDFQELLEVTGAVAEHTMSYSGTMASIMRLAGTGLPGAEKLAAKAYEGTEARWSGATNAKEDMMKFASVIESTNAIQDKLKKKGEKGLSNAQVIRLQQVLQFGGREQLTKENLSKFMDKESIEAAWPEIEERFIPKTDAQKTFTDTYMLTQDSEVQRLGELTGSGNKDEIFKTFSIKANRDKLVQARNTRGLADKNLDVAASENSAWLQDLEKKHGVKLTKDERTWDKGQKGDLKQGVAGQFLAEKGPEANAFAEIEARKALLKSQVPYSAARGPLAPQTSIEAFVQNLDINKTRPVTEETMDRTKVDPTREIPKDREILSINTMLERLSTSIDEMNKSSGKPIEAQSVNINGGGVINIINPAGVKRVGDPI